MFSRYFIWVAIAGFGLVIEGVALHLTGWLRVVVMGIGAVLNGAGLIMSTIYRYRRTLKPSGQHLAT